MNRRPQTVEYDPWSYLAVGRTLVSPPLKPRRPPRRRWRLSRFLPRLSMRR